MKKIISILLSLYMALTMIPIACAAGASGSWYDEIIQNKTYRQYMNNGDFAWKEAPSSYSLIDIDQNGIPELLLRSDEDSPFSRILAFSYDESRNTPVFAGELYLYGFPRYSEQHHALVCIYPRPNQFYNVGTFYTLSNHELNEFMQVGWSDGRNGSEYYKIIADQQIDITESEYNEYYNNVSGNLEFSDLTHYSELSFTDVATNAPHFSYIYDEADPGKSIDFAGTLDNVTDETSAMDAVDKALTEVTDEQKQSITGIDKLTLLAEEAAAKANTVSVDSGVINVTPEDIPATADSALIATTGVLSDAGVNMQRNPRAIVNYDAGSSDTVSVTTESLPETVDKVRVTTDYAMATVDAQQASSFTMSDRGNQTIEVNFDTDYETVVTVSFPGMSANDTYKAVVDAEGKPVGGKYNPATGTLEAKLTESGVYRVVNNEADFSDIKTKSQEMQDAIKELASKGIINGTTETTYAPDDTISRAEVTALLMRTLSLLNPNANGGFADVTSANWYCGAAGSAKEHNIINGFEDNTFRGDAVIAKDQIVAVSSRTLREQMDYKTPSDVNGELSVYSDAGSIENWAREDVALATMTNLVLKRTDGKFGGSAGMTRGDAAIIIKRLFDKMW